MKFDLSLFNPQQKEAVLYGDNALLVIAGAGSGKTRVLTYRVAHLLERGYLPSKLMVTTFTNKAAEEMRERLEPLIGANKADRLNIGTSHSIFYRILRDLYEWSGKYEVPKLIMGGGRWMTMVKIINRYKYSNGKYDEGNRFCTRDIKTVLNNISRYKNEGTTVAELEAHLEKQKIPMTCSDPAKNPRWTYTEQATYFYAYRDYEKELKESNRLDFDDMLFKTYVELNKEKNKAFLDKIRRKYQHILVDEAQDLNPIQYMLLRLIAGDNRRITLVGDDYQAIYKFRGVDVGEIINFPKEYNAEIIRLEQNYRSTKNIVNYGNVLIKHNTVQVWKNLFTDNHQGDPAYIIHTENCEEEAREVLEKIQELIISGYNLDDIAVIYRTNAQSRAIVDEFIVNHIPHKVYSKESFYDRKEVKDMLAYLKICCSPIEAEVEDFKRVINRPSRFLGQKFLDDVEEMMFEKDYESFWQSLQHYYELGLSANQTNNVKKFIDLISRMHKLIQTTTLNTRQIFEKIIEESGYLKWLNKEVETEDQEPDEDRVMNLDSLLTGAERFKNPSEFLIFVESMEFEKNEEEDAIHCMTAHKSKGMEFPVVFILGLCHPVMPHYKADDIEEERRVAYVALTRAKEELYISTITGKFNRMNAQPSQFIREMGLKIPSRYSGGRLLLESITAQLEGDQKKPVTLKKYDKNGKLIETKIIGDGDEALNNRFK